MFRSSSPTATIPGQGYASNPQIEPINGLSLVEANNNRHEKLRSLLNSAKIDIPVLRQLMWSGCPETMRALAWDVVICYGSSRRCDREIMYSRKRAAYWGLVRSCVPNPHNQAVLRQIRLDIPRTYTSDPFFSSHEGVELLERILLIWSMRNPACSYVQGINDVLVPLVLVRLTDKTKSPDFRNLEADSYWALSKLLADLQDHYIFGQPGIQRMAARIGEIVAKTDPQLGSHFHGEGLDILQVTFRWINCLLVRELPTEALLRVWDACLAEQDQGFSELFLYVCCALIKRHRETLLTCDFQGMMLLLQKIPTETWTAKDIETLLAQAFVLKSLFQGATAHLQ